MLLKLLRRLLDLLQNTGSDKIEPIERRPVECALYTVDWAEIVSYLSSRGIELMRKSQYQPDYRVPVTDRAGWTAIVPNLVIPADYYISNARMEIDCDDYTQKASADSGIYYQRKAFITWGDTPLGRHAFGLCIIAEADHQITGHTLFEPNAGFEYAGEVFDPGEYGYIAESWE